MQVHVLRNDAGSPTTLTYVMQEKIVLWLYAKEWTISPASFTVWKKRNVRCDINVVETTNLCEYLTLNVYVLTIHSLCLTVNS